MDSNWKSQRPRIPDIKDWCFGLFTGYFHSIFHIIVLIGAIIFTLLVCEKRIKGHIADSKNNENFGFHSQLSVI